MKEVSLDKAIEVICKSTLLGHEIDVYGSADEPLFKAKDVAEWIEHSDVSTMMRNVDDDEKVTNNVCTLGGSQLMWFLTEDGLYEVLMQSRKPIAKQFKKRSKRDIEENPKDRKLLITSSTDLCPSSYARSKATGEDRAATETTCRTNSQG